MKTTDRKKFGIERKQNYRNFIYFSYQEESENRAKNQINNQRFVVPWQMVETEKNKYLVE